MNPSHSPSSEPTYKPTLSIQPSSLPTKSSQPSQTPSMLPTTHPSSNPSMSPSATPTFQPSISTKPSTLPSASPSFVPTTSTQPSHAPSLLPSLPPSAKPSNVPTISMSPSNSPTNTPTISAMPSVGPTVSLKPSQQPSFSPTTEPTNSENSTQAAEINLRYYTNTPLATSQFDEFSGVIESYTPYFINGTTTVDRVLTECTDIDAKYFLNVKEANIGFRLSYESRYTDVTAYVNSLEEFINGNSTRLKNDLNEVGIEVDVDRELSIYQVLPPPPTPIPTDSPSLNPSRSPSNLPSRSPSKIPSAEPSEIPSYTPSLKPSVIPSDKPSDKPSFNPSSLPTSIPSISPSAVPSQTPTPFPTMNVESSTTIFVSVGAAVAGAMLIFCMGICWRRRRRNGSEHFTITSPSMRPSRANGILGGGLRNPSRFRSNNENNGGHNEFPYDDGIAVPPVDSMISVQSMLSSGSSEVSESAHEHDERLNLVDEFDNYKDQNLEKMRAELEGKVSNFDEKMSQALTMALMDDMDDKDSETENMNVAKDGMEMEADLLCEMNDWLKKREEGASIDDRREFMQEKLNLMVANVRHGIVSPEDASRTIHGCAALLGLQLEEDIPETTLIITGMIKSVSRDDVIEAFKKFGEIDNAAVSSEKRGFGVVRFTSKIYAHRALKLYRTGEIVVRDVAVSVRLLKADMPEIELNRVYSSEHRVSLR